MKNSRSRLVFAILLLISAALLGPGTVVQRCGAQEQTAQAAGTFPNSPGNTINPVDYQQDESTYSIGVCQIVVDSANAGLFAPVSATILGYPGYSPSSYTLTSPVLYDGSTVIGSSQLEGWQNPSTGGGFTVSQLLPGQYSSGGVTVGLGGIAAPWNNIGVGAYTAIPPTFAGGLPGPTPGTLAVNTEIEMFDLVCYDLSCITNDSRTPPPPPMPVDMVTAGPNAGLTSMGFPAGLFGGALSDLRQRSLGLVQQDSTVAGTAAESFFDINVQVNLPGVAGTASLTDFPILAAYPTYPYPLLRLTNDWINGPLVITNTNVTTLPPGVVYIHGSTPAVDLYFMDSGPTWTAGQHFGYITLAGHGVFTNSDTNGCAAGTNSTGQPGGFSQSQANMLLDTTLGTAANPKTPMPVPFLRNTDLFPTPGTTLNSQVNTFVTDGVTNVNDAVVSYAGGAIQIQDLVLGIFSNNIALPANLNGVGTYTATNVPISFQIIESGIPYAASGTCSISMAATNKGLASTLTYASSPPLITNFSIGVLSFTATAASLAGPIYLRQDPANASLGQRTVQATSTGYKVSSYLNFNVQPSSDHVTYLPESGSLQLQDSSPPPGRPTIYPTIQSGNLVLSWQGGATLQVATNLAANPIQWTSLTSSNTLSPYDIPLSSSAVPTFYRLRQP